MSAFLEHIQQPFTSHRHPPRHLCPSARLRPPQQRQPLCHPCQVPACQSHHHRTCIHQKHESISPCTPNTHRSHDSWYPDSKRKREKEKKKKKKGKKTYQAMTAMPKNAHKILNTNATTPLGVNPGGNGAGGPGAPFRFRKSTSFPAALPTVGMFWAVQASWWDWGMERERGEDWRREGASIMVATRPEARCHSMWQWKNQMRGKGGGGDVS